MAWDRARGEVVLEAPPADRLPPRRPEEIAGALRDLGRALAALEAAGHAHGAVGPGSVCSRPRGALLLIETVLVGPPGSAAEDLAAAKRLAATWLGLPPTLPVACWPDAPSLRGALTLPGRARLRALDVARAIDLTAQASALAEELRRAERLEGHLAALVQEAAARGQAATAAPLLDGRRARLGLPPRP